MTMQTTNKQGPGGMAGFVDDLNGAIRENPLAAGLVGMGVLWMFFGGSRVSAFGKAIPGAVGSVTSAVGTAAEATGSVVSDAVAGTAARVGEAARHVGDAIFSGAEAAVTTVHDTASAGYDAIKSKNGAAEAVTRAARHAGRSSPEFARGVGLSMQQNLTETLERQPLLLGVIGLAIGAGIASAFPSTRMEQDVMGEAGAAVKDKIQEIASETTERAKDVLDEVRKEAVAQGLSPAAAKENFKGVASKLKAVVGTSRDSIKDRLS